MVLTETISQVRAFLDDARRLGNSIGFVPTMGALHDGHWSLVDRACAECDAVAVSIFVNPLQFSAGEDINKYPQTRQADENGCRHHGVSAIFRPNVEEMYGQPALTNVQVKRLSEPLCGGFRPDHFDGVCTVVCKLFNIIQPHVAYFGEKDYQQLAVVRRMVRDLSMPVEIRGCPTVRDRDGLALSSRNAYLPSERRRQVPIIHASLTEARQSILSGQCDVEVLTKQVRSRILGGGADSIDYVSIVDPQTLEELSWVNQPVRICVAVRFGETRLIDNIAVDAKPGG